METVTISGVQFEFQPIDTTHFSLRLKGTTVTPAVYHVGQIGPENTRQLKVKGLLSLNGYVVLEAAKREEL